MLISRGDRSLVAQKPRLMKWTLSKYVLQEQFEVRLMAWANSFDFVKSADRVQINGVLEHHSKAVNRLADFYNEKQRIMTSTDSEILKNGFRKNITVIFTNLQSFYSQKIEHHG